MRSGWSQICWIFKPLKILRSMHYFFVSCNLNLILDPKTGGVMSYFNKKDKDKKASPILSKSSGFKTTSSLGKISMFSKPSGNFLSKLKNLSKRDLTMMVSGLGILVIAPVAGNYLSKPAPDNLLTPGFGNRGSADPSSIYEPGINSLSVGSPGAAGDVVTPLSVRDPLSLIRGSKPKASSAPIAPPSNYRNSLKDVAKNSFSRATKSAGAPVVVPKMQGGLRSMGSFAGSGGSRTSGKISSGKMLADAKGASSKAASRSMTGPVGGADFKGVASSPRGSSKDAMEALRNRAGKSASHFSAGSATTGAVDAAKDAVDLAGHGGSGQGSGEEYKGGSESSSKNSHSRGAHKESAAEKLANSLAEKRANAEEDHRNWMKYEVPEMIAETFIEEVLNKGIIAPIGELVAKSTKKALGLSSSSPAPYCWQPANYNPATKAWQPPAIKGKVWSENCKVYGAVKYKYVSAGKEKQQGEVLNCICGYAAEPLVGNAAGGAVVDDGKEQPLVPENFQPVVKDFDGQMTALMTNIKSGESIINKKGSDKKLKPLLEAVHSGIGELSDSANSSVLKDLEGLEFKVNESLAKYNGQIASSRNKYQDTRAKANLFVLQLKTVLNTPTLKGKTKAMKGGIKSEGVISTDAKDIIDAAIIGKDGEIGKIESINKSVGDYKTSLQRHEARSRFYQNQSELVIDIGQGYIRQAFVDVKSSADKIMSDEGKLKDKFQQIAGRPESTGGDTAMLNTKDDVGPEPAFKMIVKARGISWTKLWEKDSKFDTDEVAKTEKNKWDALKKQLNSGDGMTDGSLLNNFISNGMRSISVNQGINESMGDIPNVNKKASDMDTQILKIKGFLIGMGVNSCYFDNSNPCGGGEEVPSHDNGQNNPVIINPGPEDGVTGPELPVNDDTAPKQDQGILSNYKKNLEGRNSAIRTARAAMNTAEIDSNLAKKKFDEAFSYCDSKCGDGFLADACWAGCSVLKKTNKLNQEFLDASERLSGRINKISEVRGKCKTWRKSVPELYRASLGACSN